MRELTASEITKEALKILEQRNCYCWRQNQVPVRGRAFIGKKGLSDIQGFNKGTGQAVYCEVKKNGDVVKPDQKMFLCEAKAAGCCVLLAVQVGSKVEVVNY